LDARNPLAVALRDASAERSAIAAKKATLKQRARYTEAGLVVEKSCTIILQFLLTLIDFVDFSDLE